MSIQKINSDEKENITTIMPTPPIYQRFLLVVLGAVLFAFNLNTFVHQANLFPGGFAGMSLLIQRAVQKFTGFTIPYSVLYLSLNAFPAYISFRYIGKKFTLFSLLMIVLSSVLSDLTASLPFFVNFDWTHDMILCALFGGIINGVAITLCLYGDATSGGTDFVAIYFSEKKGRDMWNYVFGWNCGVLFVAGLLFGFERTLYSIIFQYTSTQVLNVLYRRYQKTTLIIITKKADELYEIIKTMTNHGATRFEGKGCYAHGDETMLYAVVSGEQVHTVTKELRKVDPGAFINVIRSKEILGRFFTRPTD